MSAPPNVLPTADGSAAASGGQKRKLDSTDTATVDSEASASCGFLRVAEVYQPVSPVFHRSDYYRRQENALWDAAAESVDEFSKQLRPDAAGAPAAAGAIAGGVAPVGAGFLNSALLPAGLCGLRAAVAPVYQAPILAAAASTPQSAAAFVAGAAAVTQALFQQQQQRGGAAAAGGGRGEGGAAAGATAAGSTGGGAAAAAAGGDNAAAGDAAEGVTDVLAADIARAAAAAAAAITARQSNANTAAKAFQVALKTAEMLQGSAGGNAATAPATPAAGVEPSTQTRHARKVYVGNLPVPVTQTEVQQYFNELLDSLLPNKVPGQTIIHVYVNGARRFAFLEHRSIEEANFTIGLDGINWRNCCLSLRRPQDYNPALAEQQYQEERSRQGSLTGFAVPPPSAAASPAATPHSALIAGALGIVSTTVPDSPHKIFIGGLPHSITEPACKQLLEAFGKLRALHVVKDPQRGDCKGFAFCEYLDPNVTDVAVAGLNNMRIGDRVLQVRRAMPHGHTKGVGPDGSVVCPPATPSIVGLRKLLLKGSVCLYGTLHTTLSRVIAIHNMLPPLPLVPKLLRDAVATEARIRAAAYGEVVCVDVQESLATQAAAKGEGVPVLVEFKDVDTAIQAMSGMQGSTYDGRLLSVVFSEPSPAMKKAAVMRIVMEAGASPLPVKLTPSPSPGNETAQATAAQPRSTVLEGQVNSKHESGVEQQDEKQQQQKKPERQQVPVAEHHGPIGNSAAEGAVEQAPTELRSQIKKETTTAVSDGAKASIPAADVNEAAQQGGRSPAAPMANEEIEGSCELPGCEAPKECGGAPIKEEGKEKSCASLCPAVICKSENACGGASRISKDTEGKHKDVMSNQRKDQKADGHIDGGHQ